MVEFSILTFLIVISLVKLFTDQKRNPIRPLLPVFVIVAPDMVRFLISAPVVNLENNPTSAAVPVIDIPVIVWLFPSNMPPKLVIGVHSPVNAISLDN